MSDYIIAKDGLVDVNSLQHWKYVSKKKVNGKWRYYYSAPAVEQVYNNAKQNYENAEVNARIAELNRDTNKKIYGEDGKYSDWELKKIAEYDAKLDKAVDDWAKAGELYVSAKIGWKKAKISTFPQRVIAKAVVAVGNFFSGLFGGSKKKKKKKKK